MERLVDAEAVIQKLKGLQERCVSDGSLLAGATHQIIQWCIDIIVQQPTVEIVKTGHWVKIGKHHIQEWYMMNKCSACGHAVTNSTYVDSIVYFKFCPHCGAAMENG